MTDTPNSTIVKVSLTRHYGPISYGLEAEGWVAQADPQSLQMVIVGLRDTLYSQFESFETDILIKLPATNNQTNGQGEVASEWFTARELTLSIIDGKERFNCKTVEAAFAQHGVAIYDEVITRYKLREFMGGEYIKPLHGVRVRILTGGKYKKVVEFEGLS